MPWHALTACQVHMLDLECFTYLNRALESTISPHVILATNRGECVVRGTEYDGGASGTGEGIVAPHGIPLDLLDRCMIVQTTPYAPDEIKEVLRLRVRTEGLAIAEDALEKLTEEAARSSLRCVVPFPPAPCPGSPARFRYALQLLAPAAILSRIAGRNEISVADVTETTEGLFIDARRSARVLAGEGGAKML